MVACRHPDFVLISMSRTAHERGERIAGLTVLALELPAEGWTSLR